MSSFGGGAVTATLTGGLTVPFNYLLFLENEMSDDINFNYPAEFEMKVWIVNDETGQKGQATVGLGNFEHPTPEKVQAHLDRLCSDLENSGASGFRLATKREAWDEACLEKTGMTFALPSGKGWE